MKVFEVISPTHNLDVVLQELVRGFKSSPLSRWADFRIEKDGDKPRLDIRDWGNWVVPRDEEDDGDYDWKVPDDNTSAAARKIVQSVHAKYPDVQIHLGVNEKNWFDIQIG